MPEKFAVKVGSSDYSGETPSKCPICHVTAHIDGGLWYSFNNQTVQHLFQCPSCHSGFFGFYKIDGKYGRLKLIELVPNRPEELSHSEVIKQLSPMFVEIYDQAYAAKIAGLNQICGPGFRKAVEFLIKDYVKSTLNEDAKKDKVEKSFIGGVVKEFIKDPKVQMVAERTLWLGNDETHYLRTWGESNIEDMLNLIRLTTHFIEMEFLAQKYYDNMPASNNK